MPIRVQYEQKSFLEEFSALTGPRTKFVFRAVLATLAVLMILSFVYELEPIPSVAYSVFGFLCVVFLFVPRMLTALIVGFKAPPLLGLSVIALWCFVLYALFPLTIIWILKRRRRQAE